MNRFPVCLLLFALLPGRCRRPADGRQHQDAGLCALSISALSPWSKLRIFRKPFLPEVP